MTTEELRNLGLDADQIKSVMALKGKAVATVETERDDFRTRDDGLRRENEELKRKVDEIETDRKELERNLEEVRVSIEGNRYNGDGLQRKLEEVTGQLERERHNLARVLIARKIKEEVERYNPINAEMVIKLIDRNGIEIVGEADEYDMKDVREQIERLRTTDAYLFEEEVPMRAGGHIQGGVERKFDMNDAIRNATRR